MNRKPRNTIARAQRRQQVANLYLQSWSQMAIAEHLRIAQATVCRDLKRIHAEWRAAAVRDFDTQCGIELQKLDRLEREAWAAWERSQKPSQQARMRGATSEQNAERVIRNQVGDPRFLEQVQKCIAARRALLGLDAPTRVEPVAPAPEPVVVLTPEERRAHILAIIEDIKRRQAEEQGNDPLTIETDSWPADGPGARETQPVDPGG